jgi:hypothetical protein
VLPASPLSLPSVTLKEDDEKNTDDLLEIIEEKNDIIQKLQVL